MTYAANQSHAVNVSQSEAAATFESVAQVQSGFMLTTETHGAIKDCVDAQDLDHYLGSC